MVETLPTHNPQVTAILYAYNRAHRVARSIESVLAQTFEDIELIIVDDCSTDETPEIIERFAKHDRRVRCIRHSPRGGPGKARNTANAARRGQYVAYVEGDDVWRPEKIALQLERFKAVSPKVGFLTGATRFWNAESTREAHVWRPDRRGDVYWDSFGAKGEELFGPSSAAIIRGDVLDDIGDFHEEMPRGWREQYYRRLAKKYEIDFVEEIVLDHYLDKNALDKIADNGRIGQCVVSRRIMIDSIREDLELLPEVYASELRKLAHSHCLQGQWSEGRACYREARGVAGRSWSLSLILAGSWPRIAALYLATHKRVVAREERERADEKIDDTPNFQLP